MKYKINAQAASSVCVKDTSFYTVLGYLVAVNGEFDAENASQALGLDISAVSVAVGFWLGAGIIGVDGDKESSEEGKAKHEALHEIKEKKPASYSSAELATIIDGNAEITSLIDFCNRTIEKILNYAEVADIVYLVDSVGFTPAMVMRIVDYFAGKGKKSVRYIVKSALAIYDEGINSDELLEQYIRKKTEYDSGEGFVRSLIGAGPRAFTKREKSFVEKWYGELSLDNSIVKLAYERTVDKISKPSLSYMAKILEAWSGQGFKNADDVLAYEACEGSAGTTSSGGFSLADFDEASRIAKTESESEDDSMDSFF